MAINHSILKTTSKIVVALIEAGKMGTDQVSKDFDTIYKSIAKATGEDQSGN